MEPIATAGLAINLAYLALDRFRYRKRIEESAKSHLLTHGTDSHLHSQDTYKDLEWLAKVRASKVHCPAGGKAATYRYGYRSHQDIGLSTAFAGLFAFLLCDATALHTGHWLWSAWLGVPGAITALFYSSLVGLLGPGVMIVFGRRCLKWEVLRANHCARQLAAVADQKAGLARPPKNLPTSRHG